MIFSENRLPLFRIMLGRLKTKKPDATIASGFPEVFKIGVAYFRLAIST
jgi:hypothetical protein